MKQRLQRLNLNRKFIWIAVIHWVLTFFTDHMIFDYVMWDFSNVTQMVKTAMTYGAKAVFLLVLIVLYQGLYYFFTKADKRFVKYTLIYFGINMALLLLTWPGIWRMDEFGILNSAVLLLPVFWQNYLTSLFYVFSLMLIPVHSGVIIVQCALISLMVGYIVSFFVKRFGKWGLLSFAPCLFFPVLDSNLYPMRMSVYGFMELFLLLLLWERREKLEERDASAEDGNGSGKTDSRENFAEVETRSGSASGNWVFICGLAAFVTVWRTEAVYYFVLFPLLLGILYGKRIGKKKLMRVICGYLVCALCLFVPQTVGDKLTSGNQYDLTSVVLPLVPLVDEAYGREDCAAQLEAIDRVVDVQLCVEGAAEGRSGISLFWSEPGFQREYTDAEYQAFKSAYYELILKFPGTFLKERLDCFLHSTDLLQNTTELFSAKGVANYDTFRAYPGTKPLNEQLRNTVIKALEWRNADDYESKKAGYGFVYGALFPMAVLAIVWAWCLVRRKWHGFFLLSLPLVKLPLVFLTAPSRLFMYYYPLYLIGWFLLSYGVTALLCRIWARLETPVKKTVAYAKRNGVKAAFSAAMERVDRSHRDKMSVLAASYQGCREWSEGLGAEALEREQKAQAARRFAYEPLISIAVPTYETDETYFQELLDSVRNQIYSKWELVVADASVSDRVEHMVNKVLTEMEETAAKDEEPLTEGGRRIRYIRLKENKGISDNTNAAIEAAAGDYIALLDHDDILTRDALFSMVEKLNGYGDTDAGRENCPWEEVLAVYSDEDKCDGAAERFYEPHFKPDFNLDLLLSNNYICHFLMVKASVMKELKLRREYDGAQDYDLILRLAGLAEEGSHIAGDWIAGDENRIADGGQQSGKNVILHVPKVLYHWRCHEGSTAGNTESKRYAYDAGRRALEAYYRARYPKSCPEDGKSGEPDGKSGEPGGKIGDPEEESGVRIKVTDSKHLGFYRTEYEPDLFAVRKDVAAVCGRVVCGGVVVGSPEGMFDGLRADGSGYMHRASLYMEVKEADPRALRLRPDLECSLEEALERGMKLVYDPQFIVRENK